MSSVRAVGRPRKSNLEQLRTCVWGWASCLAAGDKRPDELELEYLKTRDRKLNPHLSIDAIGSRTYELTHNFRRWCRWGNVIKDVPGSKTNAIEIVEELYPGTARWYRSCAWWAIKAKAVTPSDIDRGLLTLDSNVSEILIELDGNSPSWTSARFRRRPFTEAMAERLLDLGSFDAFVASYLLIRLSYAISSRPLFELATDLHYSFYPKISRLPQIEPYYRIFFDMLAIHCTQWRFPTIDQRVEETIFWQGIPDEWFEAAGGMPKRGEMSATMKKFNRLILSGS